MHRSLNAVEHLSTWPVCFQKEPPHPQSNMLKNNLRRKNVGSQLRPQQRFLTAAEPPTVQRCFGTLESELKIPDCLYIAKKEKHEGMQLCTCCTTSGQNKAGRSMPATVRRGFHFGWSWQEKSMKKSRCAAIGKNQRMLEATNTKRSENIK